MKAVADAEVALFDALFELGDAEEASNASRRSCERHTDYVHFKYQFARGAA
jgi:hypothetical protein